MPKIMGSSPSSLLTKGSEIFLQSNAGSSSPAPLATISNPSLNLCYNINLIMDSLLPLML
uniref:Uncharacterized protein n=1 Tax=Rhizophora mucronata TaxID=61149 RepID=A0A2P2NCL5_RHIMU